MKANRDVVPGKEKFFHVMFTELIRRPSVAKEQMYNNSVIQHNDGVCFYITF